MPWELWESPGRHKVANIELKMETTKKTTLGGLITKLRLAAKSLHTWQWPRLRGRSNSVATSKGMLFLPIEVAWSLTTQPYHFTWMSASRCTQRVWELGSYIRDSTLDDWSLQERMVGGHSQWRQPQNHILWLLPSPHYREMQQTVWVETSPTKINSLES